MLNLMARISYPPIRDIRLVSAEDIKHPPEQTESHYLLLVEEKADYREPDPDEKGQTRRWHGPPGDEHVFPVDKRDMLPIVRQLLKELEQSE